MSAGSLSMGFRIRPAILSATFCSGAIFLSAQTGPSQTAPSQAAASQAVPHIDLPSSKQLIGEAPGHPQRINNLPISMAVSPEGRYVVTVNAGYGTFESQYEQSFSVLDTASGAIADFPDSRTALHAHQTLYSGLAFSRDGSHIYASMASLTDAKGDGKSDAGSGIAVYSFAGGKISPERLIHLPAAPLPQGRKTIEPVGAESDEGLPYPAAI